MPVLKHAKKKLRQDKARTIKNKKQREQYKDLIKDAKKSPSEKAVSAAFAAIDKAAKNNLIHKNKAGRLKSSLSKILGGKKATPTQNAEKTAAKPSGKAAKTTKATPKKSAPKSKKA